MMQISADLENFHVVMSSSFTKDRLLITTERLY